VTRLLAAALAVLTVAFPLAWAPAWTYPAAAAGFAAALVRWRLGPPLAAIITATFSAAGPVPLAAEGLLILAYLLSADAPPALPGWLRQQVPLLIAALIATAAPLAAFAFRPAPSAWLTLSGIAAAVVAYLIALPPLRKR
jgi:hypothetical protein